MTNRTWRGATLAVAVFVVTAVGARAQDLTTLFSFNGADGAGPYLGSLIQATNGQFYGTTEGGGANSEGTVFEISPSGSFAMVYSFGYPNLYPQSGLVQASDGNFYGDTDVGAGGSDLGTVYRITPQGQLTTLYRFCVSGECPGGNTPVSALIQVATEICTALLSMGAMWDAIRPLVAEQCSKSL